MCQLIFNRFHLYISNSNVCNKTVQLAPTRPTQKIVFLAYVHEIIHNLHFKIHEEYSNAFQTETQSQMEPPDYIFLCFVALCLHNRHVRCISKMSLPNERAMCQFRSSKEQNKENTSAATRQQNKFVQRRKQAECNANRFPLPPSICAKKSKNQVHFPRLFQVEAEASERVSKHKEETKISWHLGQSEKNLQVLEVTFEMHFCFLPSFPHMYVYTCVFL